MMKVITSNELPQITSSQVLPFSLYLNQVLVRIRYAAVNPVDTYIREGWHSQSRPCPYTPGLDCSGDVISVGEDVKDFHVGDRVFSSGSVSGTYATHGTFSPDQLFVLPEGLSYQGGACLGTGYFTSLQY